MWSDKESVAPIAGIIAHINAGNLFNVPPQELKSGGCLKITWRMEQITACGLYLLQTFAEHR